MRLSIYSNYHTPAICRKPVLYQCFPCLSSEQAFLQPGRCGRIFQLDFLLLHIYITANLSFQGFAPYNIYPHGKSASHPPSISFVNHGNASVWHHLDSGMHSKAMERKGGEGTSVSIQSQRRRRGGEVMKSAFWRVYMGCMHVCAFIACGLVS